MHSECTIAIRCICWDFCRPRPPNTTSRLQKNPRLEDRAFFRERPGIVDLSEHLTDFGATAALMACLELVITVDTSAAHLAGCLARPTWILLPYTPDYRWLLDRGDSPWYPTVRLFRQDAGRCHAGVIERMRAELQAKIAIRSGEKGPARQRG